jgi:hypothetical protein
MSQVITFGQLSSRVGTTGTGSILVVASRVAIYYGRPALFYNVKWTSTSYTEKHSIVGQKKS